MKKHKDELVTISEMTDTDFDSLLEIILKKVLIVPSLILVPYRNEALEIVKNIDSEYATFIACALAYPDSTLWSDDKKLKKQSRVKVLNTGEMKSFLEE